MERNETIRKRAALNMSLIITTAADDPTANTARIQKAIAIPTSILLYLPRAL